MTRQQAKEVARVLPGEWPPGGRAGSQEIQAMAPERSQTSGQVQQQVQLWNCVQTVVLVCKLVLVCKHAALCVRGRGVQGTSVWYDSLWLVWCGPSRGLSCGCRKTTGTPWALLGQGRHENIAAEMPPGRGGGWKEKHGMRLSNVSLPHPAESFSLQECVP